MTINKKNLFCYSLIYSDLNQEKKIFKYNPTQ